MVEARRMVAGVRAGEGQWGMEEMQGVDNRGPVMGKLETAGGSHWKGGHLCQGVVYI